MSCTVFPLNWLNFVWATENSEEKEKNDPVQFLRFNRASKSQQKSVSRPWEYLLPQLRSTNQRIEG